MLIAIVLVLALATTFVVVVATRPSGFRIARTVTIVAPASAIFARIDDLRAWTAWSPFEKLDPEAKKAYSGPPRGVGASYHYVGARAGEGRMTIQRSKPDEHVSLEAVFVKPFQATNQVDFTLVPSAGGVDVTWAMTGHNGFVFKAFALLVNTDRLIGKDFEAGLASLKQVCESAPSAPHSIPTQARPAHTATATA